MATDPGDLVLDPTCGSGTTAFVAEQWGRRWITCDTSRVALALARTRLMTAKFPYYLLNDSFEGQNKEQGITGRTAINDKPASDIRKGFVWKRVPHVTLKAIANNEEIDSIHSKWQTKLDDLRTKINKACKQKWAEWEIPREVEDKDTKKLLTEWWKLFRERQAEMNAIIAKRADTEILYDQPYEDAKRMRVTGPFTVESLSPHRTISVKRKKGLAEGTEIPGASVKLVGAGDFGNVIIENLKKAGVQNTIKNERMKFDRLDVHPGVWIHAAGEYTDKDGKSRRVAITVGPEHGTVGPELIKEAAKEAVQGVGYDVLIVAGFAFDPHVSEEAKRYGKLVVLPTRINADLQLGDEFLKKTGAGNLFTVFGEPDVEVKKGKDGKVTVQIKGLDIYDPTTGEIRNNSTDDIACWFIDTDYNGESFFVRHAYFTGADQPYDKLKRALRTEIDEDAWTALYSVKSRPFDLPKTGKIAIKVINHYGDEVLKVYECN
jgi:adenine-specific DNA-methyltransferase